MAIYHLSAKMISRSTRSTARALAYRVGSIVKDYSLGKTYNYSHKSEVEHVELVLPEEAPKWAQEIRDIIAVDRREGVQQFSDIVESHEKRVDAQVYRELEFALPQELSDEQNIALAREYLQDQCGKLGIAVLASFHFDVDQETEERKPHCHALLLTRRLTDEGLSAKKERAWNSKAQHETWREQWAAYVNFHLKMHGIDQRIDHRSNLTRGIEAEPQPKRGTNIHHMEIRLGNDPRDIFSAANADKAIAFREAKLRNACRIIRKPEIVLDIVSKHQATFMWGDVEKVLARYIDDPDVYLRLEHKLKTSQELVLLRVDSIKQKDGLTVDHSIYTTRSMLEAEAELFHRAEKLSKEENHKVKAHTTESVIEQFDHNLKAFGGLSLDQKKALYHITSPTQLSCIVGYAGAGKTTALEAAKEIWEAEGYKVYGLAPTGRASENLKQSGINSQTLHKFLKSYEEGRCQYSSKSILVLDEAGMVDTQRFEKFLKAVEHLGIKAVVVGDGAQLQPIEAGPAFRLITEKIGYSRLKKVIRQKEEWQQEATKLFGTLKTKEALERYDEHGSIHLCEEKHLTLKSIERETNPHTIVEGYNLSRRMVGMLYHAMVDDINEKYSLERPLGLPLKRNQEIRSEHFFKSSIVSAQEHLLESPLEQNFSSLIRLHKEYNRLQEWQELKAACSEHILQNLNTCRPYMKELGVDPLQFAKQFVNKHQSLNEQNKEATRLAAEWQLPSLDPYQRKHICDLRKNTRQELIKAWYASIKEEPQKSHLMMTYSKRDTSSLNDEARNLMKQDGIISTDEFFHTIHKEEKNDFGDIIVTKEKKGFAVGDRILFGKNDNGLKVKNGSIGTILEIDQYKIKALLDGTKEEVSFAPKLYPTFDHGWAATIHKTQGITVDRSFMLATHETYRNLAYVGMTRHRESVQVFGSTLDFWNRQVFFKCLSSSYEKLSVQDYKEAHYKVEIKDTPSKLQQMMQRLGNELEAIRFITKQTWTTIAERFLGKHLEEQEIRIPQPFFREETRAKELVRGSQDRDVYNKEDITLYETPPQLFEASKQSITPARSIEDQALSPRISFTSESQAIQEERTLLEEVGLPPLDQATQDFLSANPETTLISLQEWEARFTQEMKAKESVPHLNPQDSLINHEQKDAMEQAFIKSFQEQHPDLAAQSLDEWAKQYEQERGIETLKSLSNPLTSNTEKEIKERAITQELSAEGKALTPMSIIATYEHLKWKLDHLTNPATLKEARLGIEKLAQEISKDDFLMRRLELNNKKVAQELKSVNQASQEKHLTRGFSFTR